ncbi:MAG TPA: DUF2268 domain-containing putative Zn-dependent protease [Rhodanobacteraceae bacterium]|nr:DUF2268 domain-containing putative Zn-dependent protease [Rhodanobacteraceae bacterium]
MTRPSGKTWLFALLSPLALFLCGFTTTTTDPNKAEVVTTDVAHFWEAFDDAAKVSSTQHIEIYRKEYFDRASRGLKDFDKQRHVTPESLTAHVEQHRSEYAKLRPYINEVVDQKPVIQSAFHKLAALYPGIKLPMHVYFVVGQQHGAGMNSPNGIILAADVFATPPGTPYDYTKVTPAYVPFSAVHETIHFNQAYETNDKSTLLQQAINEGTADFIASLVLQQPDVRQMTDRWKYGCPREQALYARFAKEKDRVETSPWLFDHHPAPGWPPDMGYWLGYRIAQTYYDHAADKHQALTALLQVTDFHNLLAASGYPAKAPNCVPEKPVR